MKTYYNPEDLAQFENMGEDAKVLWEKLLLESLMQYNALIVSIPIPEHCWKWVLTRSR